MGPAGRTPAQRLGDAAEAHVAASLVAAGWSILDRNAHVGRGELDLVGVDPARSGSLVFVEVRWRARRDFGLGEETVDHRKRRRVREAAWRWMEAHEHPSLPVRFDLVIVEPDPFRPAGFRFRHHRAAF
jgi:putative endonuclease